MKPAPGEAVAPVQPPQDLPSAAGTSGGFPLVAVAWLLLVIVWSGLASRTLTIPGLCSDEAIWGAMAKDFLTGQPQGQHMPGTEAIELFGRPFPLHLQDYVGALKSWLLLPGLSLFGASTAVLRLTSLALSLVGLLILMLWTRRWLGPGTALLAGAFLALDPTFFFVSLLDVAAASTSFVCRMGGFYLTWLWWKRGRPSYAVLAGVCFGLGFFSKVDFAVVLGGVGCAALCCYVRPFWARLGERPLTLLLVGSGFLVAAAPAVLRLPQILTGPLPVATPGAGGEWTEKMGTLMAMYDGSYYYRLMSLGGMFSNMFQQATPRIWGPFGLAVVSAGVLCVAGLLRAHWPEPLRLGAPASLPAASTPNESAGKDAGAPRPRAICFLLLSAILVTSGVLFLPGAVRVYHSVIVYPFPHLIVAAAALLVWRRFVGAGKAPAVARVLVFAVVAFLLVGQLLGIIKTQNLMRRTGGQGIWTSSLAAFAGEVRNRTDLTIVSLDWGFQEPLLFLTQGPTLVEPFWFGQEGLLPGAPGATNCVYLVHPPKYRMFDWGRDFLDPGYLASHNLECRPYTDRTGSVAFYVLRKR